MDACGRLAPFRVRPVLKNKDAKQAEGTHSGTADDSSKIVFKLNCLASAYRRYKNPSVFSTFQLANVQPRVQLENCCGSAGRLLQ